MTSGIARYAPEYPGRRTRAGGRRALLAAFALAAVAGGSGAYAEPPPLPTSAATRYVNPVAQRAAAAGIDLSGSAPACPKAPPGLASCHAKFATDSSGMLLVSSSPIGYTPAELQAAYRLPVAGARNGMKVGLNKLGHTHTVAIITAYDHPQIENDLAVYRATFGLPPCVRATGCFRKLNQWGDEGNYPVVDAAWASEIALDTQMVSAICPACQILLVEARSNRISDLAQAVRTAFNAEATEISNSYGSAEYPAQINYEDEYTRPHVPITASAGDDGYGSQYPAASLGVTAVGGTSLVRDTRSMRGWHETVWGRGGSGCSAYIRKPGWQSDTGCPRRMIADVAAVADPMTGVAVYNSLAGGWAIAGGTSVGAPIVAAIWALNGSGSSFQFPAGATWLNQPYLYDVTEGSNGVCSPSYFCRAAEGYDGPTGLGTPDGVAAFGGPIN